MISLKRLTDRFSAAVAGTGNNNGIYIDGEYVFKSRFRLRASGEVNLKLAFINEVESTGNFARGEKGGEYFIDRAFASSADDFTSELGVPLKFGGEAGKKVASGEAFCTDEFVLNCDKKYLVLTFYVHTDKRVLLPCTNESATGSLMWENGKPIFSDGFALRPVFVGLQKEFSETVGFMGDSITQGTRTRDDFYEAWTHRIGNSLPDTVSFWNLGLVWSRAYDAAAGGIFLEKAAMCDELFICFGVNDLRAGKRTAQELICDLKTTRRLLRERNKNILIHLLTVPPFNMEPEEEAYRTAVNEYIKSEDGCFDIASVLDAGGGRVKPEFMSAPDDAHPNGLAGEAVFKKFLAWKEESGWRKD